MEIVEQYLLQLNTQKQRFRRSVALLTVLSFLVVLTVSWNLRQTGIAIANNANCGLEEHQHTEGCQVELVLICDNGANAPTEPLELIPTDPPAETSAEVPTEESEPEAKEEKKDTSGMMTGIMVVALILGLGLAMLLFKVLPESIYELLTWAIPSLEGEGYWFNLIRAAITGVVKIAIMVAYMAAVALMKDIKRTFMYHGAEHKTIFCYEQGLELTVENVRRQSRFHPRCGTSFLILMLLVSIVINMFIPATLVDHKILNIIARTGIGLLTLPFIMGIGYELIRFAGRHDNLFTRIISAPGVWLQHITTKEPDDSMIECAIAAVKEVIPEDGSDNW